MLKVIVTCFVQPGTSDAFLALVRHLAAAARGESGCVAYQVCQDVSDGNTILLVEEWENREALFAHMAQPIFKELTNQASVLHAREPEYRTCLVAG